MFNKKLYKIEIRKIQKEPELTSYAVISYMDYNEKDERDFWDFNNLWMAIHFVKNELFEKIEKIINVELKTVN